MVENGSMCSKGKYIVFYWLEKTAINSCSENGQGRKRDRQQFETDFDALY